MRFLTILLRSNASSSNVINPDVVFGSFFSLLKNVLTEEINCSSLTPDSSSDTFIAVVFWAEMHKKLPTRIVTIEINLIFWGSEATKQISLPFPRRVSGKSSLAVGETHGNAVHKISSRVSDDANMFSCVAMGDAALPFTATVGFTHG